MMTHDEMIAVIQHHKNGGKVEYKHCDNAVYVDDVRPSWDFSAFDYRPKPEPMTIYAEVSTITGGIMQASTGPIFHRFNNTTIKRFIEAND